jgi:undecaprenyl-diphosphatase
MSGLLTYIDSGDRAFSDFISQWSSPRWFQLWMLYASRLGDGWLWAALGLTLAASGDYGALTTAALACSVASVAMIGLKRRFRRCRPRQPSVNEFFQMMRADFSSFDSFSFPSGHTVNAFAIGTVLSSLHPGWLPVMLFIAVSVGSSRVFLRLHFVTDVLVGASLGVLIGACVCGVLP